MPRSKQGSDDLENLALSCPACNAHKHTKLAALDPLTRKVVPIFHPRTQHWQEHFFFGGEKPAPRYSAPTQQDGLQ
ncbi:MAG: HNH endonuclease [Lewinellaceae bacterium]|nr:HNH endonuclease [Lewinellaceae bacterium]